MEFLKKLERKIRKYLKKRFGKPEKPRFYRANEKFNERYPDYKIGRGSYGVPIVHDWHEGSTLNIGSYCSISANVQIFLGGHHRADWVTTYPFPAFLPQAAHIPEFSGTRGDVDIGSDVWLCANCIILSGVRIGHGAVIANGAVVTRDVPAYAIVAGNPARVVRWRFDERTRDELLASAWWDWPEEEVLGITDKLCNGDIQAFLAYAATKKHRHA